MAEGGPNRDKVEQLLTPVSVLHICSSASVWFTTKREATSPTGQTPVAKKVSVRSQYRSQKRLSFSPEPELEASGSSTQISRPWTDSETKLLLKFLLFHRVPGTNCFWTDCGRDFWIAAARFVQTQKSTELPTTGAVTDHTYSQVNDKICNLQREYRDCRRDKTGITRYIMMHQVLYNVHVTLFIG